MTLNNGFLGRCVVIQLDRLLVGKTDSLLGRLIICGDSNLPEQTADGAITGPGLLYQPRGFG